MILGILTSGDWIAICSIGTVVILAFLGLLGKIIFKWGALDKGITSLEGVLDKGITSLDRKFDKLDEKFDKFILQPLATNKSPLNLTEPGRKIFIRLKIQEFVKDNTEEIFLKMKETKYESAYQAQEKLFEVVDSYKTGRYQINLENEAFETGQHIDILMKVIAIGIRNEIFAKLGLKVEDIDNSKPTETKTP
ncbi:MAG TPA: hypothetical protein VMV77_03500 [Bacteroidales bacterium]|nr:hypothetical protein [Bacteroidales bacterium]